jgi:hypothetical protein
MQVLPELQDPKVDDRPILKAGAQAVVCCYPNLEVT